MSYGEDFVHSTTTIPFPSGTTLPTIDFEVNIRGERVLWSNRLGNDIFDLCVFYFLSFAINYTYTCMLLFSSFLLPPFLIHVLYSTCHSDKLTKGHSILCVHVQYLNIM